MNLRPRKRCRLIVAVLLLACAFGCGRYTESGRHGYAAAGKDWVIFLQFTEKEGRISGQVQAVRVEGGTFRYTEVRNPSFTAMRDGSNVSLNFAGFHTERTITGTLSGDTLSLVMPQPSGLLATVESKRATADEYNAQAEKLKRRIADANEATRQAQAAAARTEEARRKAADGAANLTRAYDALTDRIADLDVTPRLEETLVRFNDHWREMREHEKEFKEKASARPLDTYKFNDAKYALNRLGFDRQHVGFDRQNLNYAIAAANERIKKTREAVASLREAWGDCGRFGGARPRVICGSKSQKTGSTKPWCGPRQRSVRGRCKTSAHKLRVDKIARHGETRRERRVVGGRRPAAAA